MCLYKNETQVANYCTFQLKEINVCWPQQNNSRLALSPNTDAIKKLFKNHLVDKVKKLWYYRRLIKITLITFLSLCLFPNLGYSSKYFAQIYRAQYGAAMLVYLHGKQTLRLENSVNIWNLLWLSRLLIICIEQTSIYISTFPSTLTSEWAKTHKISICFSSNAFVAQCHAPPYTNSEIQNVSLAWETQKQQQQQWQRLRRID